MGISDNKHKPVPFWSWNDQLDIKELSNQIDWMNQNGIGGFVMHARGGLKEEYLGEKWFKCIESCLDKAHELNMEAFAYDENGWPSGFVGGKLLKDPFNRDMFLTYSYGKYDPKSAASFKVNKNQLVKVDCGEDVLNIYTNLSTSTVDICNPQVVREFIHLTHEQYKEHDPKHYLKGFFTDEPQYYRWGVPFTQMLCGYFKEHYHEDVFDRIGLLFEKKEGYRDYRYKYYKALQDLMLNSYAKQVYQWCDENGYLLTGHYVEEISLGHQIMACGGVMPFYEYEHIPGVDHLGRDVFTQQLTVKQLSSAMCQLGKNQGLCEMFACVGWDATPLELKRIANSYLVGGINRICHHLVPYSEHGQRKRDYPEHYSKINPWVDKDFKMFNDEFNQYSELLAKSKEICNVGVLLPIRSAYFDYDRREEANGFGIKELDESFGALVKKLGDYGLQFHLLDETLLDKHGYIHDEYLCVGNCRYKYVIIPEHALTMDSSTEKYLREFVQKGGKILLMGDAPTYLEGQPHKYDYLKSNVTFEEILSDQPYQASLNENIRLSYRIWESGVTFIFAVNLGDETDLEIKVPDDEYSKGTGKMISQRIHFDKAESKIINLSLESPAILGQNNILKLSNSYQIEGSPTNYLNIDYLTYSKEGKSYSKCLHHLGIFNKLLKENYAGPLYLKYVFDVHSLPKACEALIERMNSNRDNTISINGVNVKPSGTVLEKDLLKYDIAKYLKVGMNELVVETVFYENENVHYALFGENVQESLKNCLVYDTTIEAVILRGDFGVYGSFIDGATPNVVVGESFYLDKQKTHITSLIRDGYPFFRGDITLSQEIDVDDVNQTLVIDERFQLIDLYVNDTFVKRMMFDYKVDLSKFLKKGKNTLKLVLTGSNRNLLGPFHYPVEEPFSVGPHTYERFGSWNDEGESPLCVGRYAFVKTIV